MIEQPVTDPFEVTTVIIFVFASKHRTNNSTVTSRECNPVHELIPPDV